MLKHRHEIASGMTSSVTQELIGYRNAQQRQHNDEAEEIEIMNYASSDVKTWMDIHTSCESGRVVFISDSAGHPRFRRTTVRGLVGWAPHWTLLCIPADNAEDTSGRTGSTPPSQEVLGSAAADVDLSAAHLDLCLRLGLPLVIIITKYDLASQTGLRRTLSKTLSMIKAAGRAPALLADRKRPNDSADLQFIPADEQESVETVIEAVRGNVLGSVPIVFTSAVDGKGVTKLHALLHELPIPERGLEQRKSDVLFHVEDVFTSSRSQENNVTILGGYLRSGRISVGDKLLLGPYATDHSPEDSDSSPGQKSRAAMPTSRSYPGALDKGKVSALRSSPSDQEWRLVVVSSIRNLRLPVRTLHPGQVGTMGVIPTSDVRSSSALIRVRKGMVMSNVVPRAVRVFSARFGKRDVQDLHVGAAVVVYVASVRASAKVIAASIEDENLTGVLSHAQDVAEKDGDGDDDAFGFGFEDDVDAGTNRDDETGRSDRPLIVTLQFIAAREYVETGAQVLIMPGGGPGLYGGTERGERGVAGLEGFVGRVVEGFG